MTKVTDFSTNLPCNSGAGFTGRTQFGELMMRTEMTDRGRLPVEWTRAFERDAEGPADYADPAWERKAARVLAAFILSGIFFLPSRAPFWVFGIYFKSQPSGLTRLPARPGFRRMVMPNCSVGWAALSSAFLSTFCPNSADAR